MSKISDICGGRFEGRDHTCRAAFTDSRSAAQTDGALFFAIAGVNHDGHDYIGALYERGARAFVVERPVDAGAWPEAGFVHVGSSVAALQALAAHHRNAFGGIVVAVTGSNGKTVVKEWAAQIAPHCMKMARSPRSYNSQIGVPLSVLMINGDEDVALIEAGISRPGEMARLEAVIRPDIGIITNIGDSHQENFSSLGQKLAEKLVLFKHARKVIYNSRYTRIERALKHLRGVKLVDAAAQKEAYAHFSERTAQENAASVVALYDTLGYPHVETVSRLALLQPVAMRLELREGIAGSVIINDSYNSDINSLSIALDYLRSVAGGKPKMLVISDILESGLPDRELYAKVARMVADSGVGHLVGIGDRIRRYAHLFECEHEFHPTTESYIASMEQSGIAGQTILLKGNRASQFEKLSHALQLKTHTTTLEVDLDAMAHNLGYLRTKAGAGVKVMAMIKALSYGNGGFEVAAMLQRQGVDYLAVAFADEGMMLRQRGITAPIVVLNADQDSFDVMIEGRLEPEIYSHASLGAFMDALTRHSETDYPIHIKLDTGMHRLGFEEADVDSLISRLTAGRMVRVASVFSHLAASDEAQHDGFTQQQTLLFDCLSGRIAAALPYPVLRHLSNSAAIERVPEARFDMVRLGIGLYGVSAVDDASLRPVSALRSRIVQIKEIPAGQTVGYGRAGRIDSPRRIATVPIGYADGLRRSLSNGAWSMLASGRPAPIVGRVCMDTCMIDITDIDASEGDQVTVFGPEPGYRVQDMAAASGTIAYEIMTGISARVKRIYTRE